MYCHPPRYNLGDEQVSPDDIKELIGPRDVVLPLYLYDHSGLTIRTYAFNDSWDSGLVGFIVATAEAIRKEWDVRRISAKLRAKARDILVQEVKTYDQYLQGEVYGYVVERDGEHVDSCWGFYGLHYCISEAEAAIPQAA